MSKKILLGILIIFIFVTAPAFAKSKQAPPQKAQTIDDIVAKMKLQLGLSDQQVIDVKPIIEDYLAREKQLKLEEKKALGKVLTGQQLFTWDFIQNPTPRQKKKQTLF